MIANYKISEHPIAHAVAPKSANNPEKFSFSGFGLDNDNVLITDFAGLHNAGSSDFHDVGNINTDGGKFQSRFWRKKNFEISGILKAKTPEELENLIDNFKKNFNTKEWIFRWKYTNTRFREIPVTAQRVDFDRKHYHITFIPFTLSLVANNVYWREWTNIKKFSENRLFVAEIQNEWNVASEIEIIFIVKNGNIESIKLDKNWQKLNFNNPENAKNIIVNTAKRQIKLNGKIGDYSGVHFTLEPWRNEIIFDFTGTFEADIYVKWDTNFL